MLLQPHAAQASITDNGHLNGFGSGCHKQRKLCTNVPLTPEGAEIISLEDSGKLTCNEIVRALLDHPLCAPHFKWGREGLTILVESPEQFESVGALPCMPVLIILYFAVRENCECCVLVVASACCEHA